MAERIFYRVSEIGDLIGCSKSKAYELVHSGAIGSTRIGTLLRVSRAALEVFIRRTVAQGEISDGCCDRLDRSPQHKEREA